MEKKFAAITEISSENVKSVIVYHAETMIQWTHLLQKMLASHEADGERV